MTDIRALLQEALEKRQGKYKALLKYARKQFSPEAVHDLRVAIRRLLALLELIREVSPQPHLKPIRRALKAELDHFDTLRDTQVMLAEISERMTDLPGLADFQAYLQKREKKLLKKAHKAIQEFKPVKIKKLEMTPGDPLRAVDEAFRLTMERYGEIDPANPATIHLVRVRFKRFRYSLEVVHPLLSDFPAENLEEMHAYQGRMGEIQDAEVFLSALDEFGAGELRPFYEARHAEAIRIYLEEMGQIHRFWRADPTQNQPWEKPE